MNIVDTELIRTFLEVNRTRHFTRAAEHLFVTPAAVSARVRLLEEQLGSRLFTRSRRDIRLTPAGQRFLPHAEHLWRSWNRARLSLATNLADLELLSLGSLHSIWAVLLDGWLPRVYDLPGAPLLQVDLLTNQAVVARVREQSLDLGLVYEPPRVSDLTMSVVASVALVLVASRPGLHLDAALTGYVHVDWGPPFAMTMTRNHASLPEPVLRVDAPELALEYLGSRGGAAYLPRLAVAEAVAAGRLHPVAGAPVVERPVYLIGNAAAEPSPAQALVRRNLIDWVAARAPAAGGA